MKLLSSFLPFAFASRDPNFKYNKRVVEGLTGTDCDVNSLTVARFEADIKCAEGEFIAEETMCTLQCTSQGTAPVFAELLCRKGELHPPGFLMNYFWSDWDMENGLKISCEVPDEVPEPGVKRGMAIWNTGQQAEFVKTYNLPSKHPSNFTIGWISFWSLNHNWWAFQNEGDEELLVEENHVWPIMSYPRCTQETDSRYGDGSCDQDSCASVPWGTNTCTHPKFTLPRNNEVIKTGEKWMGYLNEPYGENQANLTVPNAFTLWPSFWDRVVEHADNHGVSTDEIKIVGPSIASKDGAMRWGEDFYFNLPENIRIDAINVHEYNINGGQQAVDCNCEPKLLRDTLSHYRAKFGLPVWLVEFNCGNGWWDCPNEQHHDYMKETLPMLEEMPWVVRYNWMAALTETQFGALNSNVEPFPLTELGETYNQFVWDRVNTHNPQWGDSAGAIKTTTTTTTTTSIETITTTSTTTTSTITTTPPKTTSTTAPSTTTTTTTTTTEPPPPTCSPLSSSFGLTNGSWECNGNEQDDTCRWICEYGIPTGARAKCLSEKKNHGDWKEPSAKNKAKADCSLCKEVGTDLTPANGTWDCKNLGVKRFCQLNCPDRKRAVFAECIVSRNEGFAINSQLSLEDNTCEAVIGPCDVSLVKKNAPDNFKWNGIDYSSTFDFSTSHSNTKIALWGRRRCNSGSGFHHNTQILCKINRNGAKWIYKGNANKKCRND